MPLPSLSSWFDQKNNIRLGVQIIKLLVTYFPPFPCYLVPLRPIYPLQHLLLVPPQPMCFPSCNRPSFTPILNNSETTVLYILNVIFLTTNWKTKASEPHDRKYFLTSVY
jgi:hypothetical protein